MSLDRLRDAVQFLTIIPVGASNDAPDSEWLVRSAQFFRWSVQSSASFRRRLFC